MLGQRDSEATIMKKAMTAKKSTREGQRAAPSPSKLIDARIKELGDWRGEMLARVRAPDQAGRS